ncbi:TatD family hydrolase [Aliivibrio sp. S3MY1]|uniref:TatD family hydrolase n=1 Tax=unclassified Aliivibrio TaxID=2645654 RepID=UPI0023794EA4|nr:MULTISPECIES: TatD family hydrolase [unclassified Aliivibrio]MDD9195883.1 TatD family hydrolase [Aliivibrio sp. S3MY1]MDD9199441.1 TatD family hydrolase [Aliivibrio sp. S2MY1]
MTFEFIDSHCHLDFSPFSENEAYYLQKAQKKGVSKFIVPSVNQFNWTNVASLSQRHESIYYALGIHPLFISNDHQSEVASLTQFVIERRDKCVAIGECGLDFWDPECNKEAQIYVFQKQCFLAKQYELPLIIHSRKSHDVVLKILREMKLSKGGVIHGFSGSLQQAEQFMSLGFLIGVGGIISYERAKKTKDVISQIPLSKILLETDAPDMPLSGFQGEINSPDRVLNIFECLCLLRNESKKTIANAVYRNANDLFGI